VKSMTRWGCWLTTSDGVSRWIFLSHLLDSRTPAYGNGEGLQAISDRAMDRGDSCNTARWIFSNHLGTHIDFPRHFSPMGQTVEEYHAAFWHFRLVKILDVHGLGPGSTIESDTLELDSLPSTTELLLLKTGSGDLRKERSYWEQGPIFSPYLAGALRRQCPSLRVFGIDALSISSWANRQIGRETHRAFLDHTRPVLLLEDLDLSAVSSQTKFEQVIITPLRVAGADGSPCTVLAEVGQ